MKNLLSTIGLAVAVALPAAAIAQGRHDEKPHGVLKKGAQADKEARTPGTGGRHDEGPTSHGKKAAPKKKPNSAEESPASK